MSVCKLVNVHVHVQTRRLTAPKFGTEIQERIFEKTSKRFLKNRPRFLKMIFKNNKIFFYFTILPNFVRYSKSPALKFSIETLKRDFEKILKRFFQKSL